MTLEKVEVTISGPTRERRYDKKRLLEKFENQFAGNAGSLLLARGLIEHMFKTQA